MKKLTSVNLPNDLLTTVSISHVVTRTLEERYLRLSRMSGYPAPAHIIARIYGKINLTSLSQLKTSLIDLQKLVVLAHEILATVPLARIDRYQLNKAEMEAYVLSSAASFGFATLSPADAEFVTSLIVSSESTESSWYLGYDTSRTDNRILKFYDLYKSIATTYSGARATVENMPTIKGSAPGASTGAVTSLPFPDVYDPFSGTVVPFLTSSRVQSALNSIQAGTVDEFTLERIAGNINAMHACATFADIRLLDHVFQLMNSLDIWSSFITLRDRIDAAVNVERVRGLKKFSAYIQSLLMYYDMFNVITYEKTYARMEKYVGQFPALGNTVYQNYQEFVLNYDVLNIQKDVDDIYSKINSRSDNNADTTIIGFYDEFASFFGVTAAVTAATRASSGLLTPIVLTNLTALASPRYNIYLYNQPTSVMNLMNSVIDTVTVGAVITDVLRRAVSMVLPYVHRIYPGTIADDIRALNLHLAVGFGNDIPFTKSPIEADDRRLGDNGPVVRRAAPWHSADAQRMYNRKLLYLIATGSDYNTYLDNVPFYIDNKKSSHYRSILGFDWKGLYPSWMLPGESIKSVDLITADALSIGDILETISGSNWEYIKATIGAPHIQEFWATYLSSWAILFSVSESAAAAGTATPVTWTQVIGYGQPYGVTYPELLRRQAWKTPPLIRIGDNAAIAILRRIPLPSDTLTANNDFYMRKPYYNFPASSQNAELATDAWTTKLVADPSIFEPGEVPNKGKLIYGEGLMHMSLTPCTLPENSVPTILFTKTRAYINERLYISADPNFRLIPQTKPEYKIGMETSVLPFNFVSLNPNVEYVVWTKYGSAVDSSTLSPTITDPLTALEKSWQQELEKTEKESTVSADALRARKLPEAAMANELSEGVKKETSKNLAGGNGTDDKFSGKKKNKPKHKGNKAKAANSFDPVKGKMTEDEISELDAEAQDKKDRKIS